MQESCLGLTPIEVLGPQATDLCCRIDPRSLASDGATVSPVLTR